jgi:acyl-CoA hydrolase
MKPLNSLSALIAPLAPERGIVLHSGPAHPTRLGGLLAEQAQALQGRRVYTLMPLGPLPYAEPPARDQLALTSFLPGAGLRPAMDAGRLTPFRQPLSTVPADIASGTLPVGAVLLRVSPPDERGRVCLGVAVDYMMAAVQAAQVVVAELDPRMPRAVGDCWIEAARIDAWVDAADPPHEVADAPGQDAAEAAIAANIASLVEDGAVLQLGVGSLPEQVLARLGQHRHLGLHTGIIGDGARQLIERGVIDNSRKEVFAGVSIATMALGSRGLYDFLDGNAAVQMHPCSTTHAADVLARLSRLCAINSAVQVDLHGRVNAEWAGRRRIAVPGGLPDFARAASRLPHGRSIVALRSTNRAGESTLVDSLAQPASLEPHEVDFFVTEHGVAPVRGCSPRERRKALVAIAHPAHRERLASA